MSLKQELQTWSNALTAFNEKDLSLSLSLFSHMPDSSKIQYNIATIYGVLGDHGRAVHHFSRATQLDQFLAVAHFQRGVTFFMLGQWTSAVNAFEDARIYLRGNALIDYEQIGLNFRLQECEVLFNRGLSLIRCGNYEQGMSDLKAASKEKRNHSHSVIDEAIARNAQGYTVFRVPEGRLFKPAEAKIRNLEPRDYLGKARLVAATSLADLRTSFAGAPKAEANIVQASPRVLGTHASSLDTVPAQPLTRAENSQKGFSRTPSLLRSRRAAPSRPERIGITLQLPEPAPLTSAGRRHGFLPYQRSPSLPRFPQLPALPRTPTHARSSSVPVPKTPALIESSERSTDAPADDQTAYRGDEVFDSYYGTLTASPTRAMTDQLEKAISTTAIGETMIAGSHAASSALVRASSGHSKTESSSTSHVHGPGFESSESALSTSQTSGSANTLSRSDSGQAPRGTMDGTTAALASRLRQLAVQGAEQPVSQDAKRLRIRLRHKGIIRAMIVMSDSSLDAFIDRVKQKLGETDVSLKCQDPDGAFVALLDAEDWANALNDATQLETGKYEGKMDIWVGDGDE